jgi:cytochrome c5
LNRLLLIGITSAVVTALSMAACGGATPDAASAEGDEVDGQDVVESKCDSCHDAPKPGLPRASIEAQFTKHEGRIELSDAEKSAIADYLAAE